MTGWDNIGDRSRRAITRRLLVCAALASGANAFASVASAEPRLDGRVPVPPSRPAILVAAAHAAMTSEFNIPAGDLASALKLWADVSHVQVLASTQELNGLRSGGATGAATPETALRALLAGTGLTYLFTDATTVTIVNPQLVQLTQGASPSSASDQLDEILVEGDGRGGSEAGQPPPTGTIGQPPKPFAGGQVASGGRVGFLGSRSVFDTPFTQNSYTEQVVRDQQSLSILGVLDNNPAVRAIASPFSPQTNVFVRGFEVNATEFAFDGLYGVTSRYRHAPEGAERIEVLNGPAAFLFGFPPEGNVGGVVNIIPKRAPEEPLARITTQYASDSTFGGAFDVGRRFGDGDAFGVRVNGVYREGHSPIDRNNEQFGSLTLGLDYRGDRFRFSADFGYQDFDGRALTQSFFVAEGIDIPRAPSLTSSVQQPWERFDSSHAFSVGRAEFDVTDDVTVFGAIGGSKTTNDLLSARPRLSGANGSVILTPNSYIEDGSQWTAETGVRARFKTGPIEHAAAVVGTHYERHRDFSFVFLPELAFPSNIFDPDFAPRPVFPSDPARTIETRNLDGLAVTDTLSILDGRVQVIGGGRFQRAQTRTRNTTGFPEATRYDKTAATPMGAVIVKPLQNLSLYVSYAEGFGFGPTPPPAANNPGAVFPPVVTKQIEAGAKLDLGAVGATLAFYEIKRPSGVLNQSTGVFGVDGEQRNRGVDFNLFGEPLPGLRVLGGVTLLDGVLTKTADGEFDGNIAAGAPDMQLNLGGEIDMPPWLAPGVTLNGRVLYTTKQYLDQANTQSIPDFARLDLGARYRFDVDGTPVTARFNVLNVAGKDYWASTGGGYLSLGTPRTFLLSLSADLNVPPSPVREP